MGTNPGLSQGQVLTPGQWNALFASKQDNLNFVPLNSAGGSMTGPLITTASIAVAAGFNIPPGTAPTLPNNGDIWNNGTNFFAEIGSASIAFNMYQGTANLLTPPNPAPTTSPSGVMMGLGAGGSGIVLTNQYSVRGLITIQGVVFTTSGTGVVSVTLCTGSGTIPANGTVGPTGTVLGTGVINTIPSVGQFKSFSVTGIAAMVPGVKQWFDLSVFITGGGTAAVANVTGSVLEF